MSEWDRFCDEYEDISSLMELTPEYIILSYRWIQVKTEGDRLQLSLEVLDEEALQQLHELDDCKEILQAIRDIIDDPAVILSCRGNYVYDQVKVALDR